MFATAVAQIINPNDTASHASPHVNRTVSSLFSSPLSTIAQYLLMNDVPVQGESEAVMMEAFIAAQRSYFESRFYILQLFLLAGYGIMFTLCVILICYMRYNRSVAFRGDAAAARKIILPAFEPLLWILGGTTGIYTIYFCVVISCKVFTSDISKVAAEFYYSGRQFVFLSVIVFMLQKSVSIPSLQRTVLTTFVFSTYTIPIVWYMSKYGSNTDLYYVTTISRALLLLLYTYVFIHPPLRASKRTIREFCAFAYLYYTLLFTYGELFHHSVVEAGFNLTYANLLCGSLCPLVIWRVLKADTEYWRGMGQRACALQTLFRQKHNIHERVSSQGLHILIEMHRKFIIDFAYLKLKQRIGMGASAVVFKGVLHSRTPVAIKVYTPSQYTEETVAAFSQEAALSGALKHPNIVKFYGMCVCPPTICLVSELCLGSLEDVTLTIVRRLQSPFREQFIINLNYMLDAARAVAYIHSFSPAFVHRDIKPANFLVDSESNVKLTDFGESRSLPRAQIVGSNSDQGSRDTNASVSNSHSNQEKINVSSQGIKMTVRGTVDYMAPEVINGKSGVATYGEAADVYSLAITMWDILYPDVEKFPMINKNHHLQIFDVVMDGKRPPLGQDLHPAVYDVIESAWHADARMRPSAQEIVRVLESVQGEVLGTLAVRIATQIEQDANIQHDVHGFTNKCFHAEEASEKLEKLGCVDGPGEAIRVGNAFMDAGFLHHIKHSQCYEHSSSLYLFDESSVKVRSKFGNLPSTPSTTHVCTVTSRSDPNLHEKNDCECHKLGQRLEPTKLYRRRFRKKGKTAHEENMLTTRLLVADGNSEFDGFDENLR